MTQHQSSKSLKKELTLFKIYCLATGATLSSGFFLLPGLAAANAGPAVIVSYLIAAIHIIPAVFCMAELSTAMPRAGGVYYFLDRSLGPLMGAIGGLGTWLALILKTSFALVGMGAYVSLFLPEIPITPVAVGLAIIFGAINLLGAKKSGGFQIVMVFALLIFLSVFLAFSSFQIEIGHFSNFFASGFTSIYGTAGLVYISYVGITNIASVSEEVKNPEKNLPLGMFLALGTAILIYVAGTTIMVGLIPPADFSHDLTPVASAGKIVFGKAGAIIMTIAAILAFFSVSNAAILSASRYPLAMSRDHLLPGFFRTLSKQQTPKYAIYSTVLLIIACLVFLDPTKIAKLASAFQLLLFSLCCLAVIIMRESQIESYDPGYHSPFYPWLHLFGMIAPLFLIVEMGWYPAIFTISLVTLAIVWYWKYAKPRISRGGAIFHYFARLGERRYLGLDRELRGILKEKGLREEDPFDMVISRAILIDISERTTFEKIVKKAALEFEIRLEPSKEVFEEGFLKGTRIGATPVSHGAALPHMRLANLEKPEIVVIRSAYGIQVLPEASADIAPNPTESVYAFFFLVSPEENPGQHLRLLAQIAGQVDNENFMKNWLRAKNEQHIKELLLRDERFLSLKLKASTATATLIDKAIRDLNIPEGSLITMIHRRGEIIIPRGRTILKEGDRLTIIGEPDGISQLTQNYTDH